MLGIRVDGNNKIGTGHMMRCLAIAEQARRRGHDVLFICAADDDTCMIEQRDFRVELLPTAWNAYAEESAFIGGVLERFQVSVLLIDSYCVTADYMRRCRTFCRTAYIDDLHASIWNCDFLINYAQYADNYDYEREYPDTSLFLGCAYAPLREMFSDVKKEIQEKVSEVLVLTGGTDPFHFARDLAAGVLSQNGREQRHYTVVCGIYNADRQTLLQMAEDSAKIDILFNVQDMRALMEQADIAVTAGGTTMYELAACGTPSICYSFVDNQLQNTKSFADSGHMLYAGDLREQGVVQTVLDDIDALADNWETRKEMSQRLQALVDGKGAKRLVKALLEE